MWINSVSSVRNCLNTLMIYLLEDQRRGSMSPLGWVLRHCDVACCSDLERAVVEEALLTFRGEEVSKGDGLVCFGSQSLGSVVRMCRPSATYVVCATTERELVEQAALSRDWHIVHERFKIFSFFLLVRRGRQSTTGSLLDARGIGQRPFIMEDEQLLPKAFNFSVKSVSAGILFAEMKWFPYEFGSCLMSLTAPGLFDRGASICLSGDVANLHNAHIAASVTNIRFQSQLISTVGLAVPDVDSITINVFPAWSIEAAIRASRGLHSRIKVFDFEYFQFS